MASILLPKLGILGPDKKYYDSDRAELNVTLTKDWKQYSIDLSGKDLSCIMTGFVWTTVAPNPNTVCFYLDDIQYE